MKPLGKIIRIDINNDTDVADDRNFAIPPGNPYEDGIGGLPGMACFFFDCLFFLFWYFY